MEHRHARMGFHNACCLDVYFCLDSGKKCVYCCIHHSVLRVADSFSVRWTLLLCIHLFLSLQPRAGCGLNHVFTPSVRPSIHINACAVTQSNLLCITSETLRTSDGNNSHKCLIGYKNTFNHFSTQKLKNRKFQILLDTL